MDWKDKKLWDRIDDRWSEKDAPYSRINDARDVVTEYFRPDMGQNPHFDEDGKLHAANIYEGSGPWAARVMATGFQGNMVSKSVDWIMYQMEAWELRAVNELDKWCQDVKEHNSAVYQRSNFYDVQPQLTLDGLTYGSPVMFGEDDILNERIMWLPQHYKYLRLYYDRYNQLEGLIIRDPAWTAKKVFDTFCQGTTIERRLAIAEKKFSQALYNKLIRGQHNDAVTILRAVFKGTDPIWQGDFKKPAGAHTWYSVYFEDPPEPEKKGPLEVAGFFSQPFVTWDYDKKPWESASRTPAFEALYDNLSLQQIFKNYLENLQYKNRPPRAVLANMANAVDFSPEAKIEMQRAEWNYAPKAIDVIGDIKLSVESADMFSQKLQRHFHHDLFLKFTEEARIRKQPLTATQIWQMAGEKATLLSPAIESHSAYLKQVDDRVIDIESRAGRGPFARDIVENVYDIVMWRLKKAGGKVKVMPVFVGPLARAQKIQQAVEPIVNGLRLMAPVFEMFPETRYAIKRYELIDRLADASHFPRDIIHTKEEWDEIIEGVQAQAEQRENFENTLEVAKVAPNITKALELMEGRAA